MHLLFDFPIIIYCLQLSDDLLLAPDFLEYMLANRKLLFEDSTVWCISAFNDNGKEELIVKNNSLLHRTDFFPGFLQHPNRLLLLIMVFRYNETFSISFDQLLVFYLYFIRDITILHCAVKQNELFEFNIIIVKWLLPIFFLKIKKTFSGLGWMLTSQLWEELKVKWPETFWDDWMRDSVQRQGRACIRPEISRTGISLRGKKGVSKYMLFHSLFFLWTFWNHKVLLLLGSFSTCNGTWPFSQVVAEHT